MTRFLLAVLVLANIASAIGVVYARHRHRVLFDEVTRLERARDELNVEFGRLQLEQATVAEATRIDQVARVRLARIQCSVAFDFKIFGKTWQPLPHNRLSEHRRRVSMQAVKFRVAAPAARGKTVKDDA